MLLAIMLGGINIKSLETQVKYLEQELATLKAEKWSSNLGTLEGEAQGSR
jgi:hypothetical protein